LPPASSAVAFSRAFAISSASRDAATGPNSASDFSIIWNGLMPPDVPNCSQIAFRLSKDAL
jgi:hypothetical protein